tara:strand:+ start:1933 stop:2466 length:534 start_codon:yes stop_codon:yes gene_type:complete
MSRVGKNPVLIPDGVSCAFSEGIFSAKGSMGVIDLPVSSEISVDISEGKVTVSPASSTKKARALWGTTQRLISSLVEGVSKGFSKRLEINGVGYRASVQGSELVLQLGFSHDVRFPIPDGIKITCEKPTLVVVSGFDKQKVGQVASEIRSYRPPEPYKGKGVKYEGEWILRKEGKKK